MSKSVLTQVIVSRRILIRTVLAVVALLLLALIPGAVGRTFWVAFLAGVVVLIALSVIALARSRRSRAR